MPKKKGPQLTSLTVEEVAGMSLAHVLELHKASKPNHRSLPWRTAHIVKWLVYTIERASFFAQTARTIPGARVTETVDIMPVSVTDLANFRNLEDVAWDKERLRRRIDAARSMLSDIIDGTYSGGCTTVQHGISCLNEIPLERLEVMPWARLCTSCSEGSRHLSDQRISVVAVNLPVLQLFGALKVLDGCSLPEDDKMVVNSSLEQLTELAKARTTDHEAEQAILAAICRIADSYRGTLNLPADIFGLEALGKIQELFNQTAVPET